MKKTFHLLGLFLLVLTSCFGKHSHSEHDHGKNATEPHKVLEHKQEKLTKATEKVKKYDNLVSSFQAEQEIRKKKIQNLLEQLAKTEEEQEKAMLTFELEHNYKQLNKTIKNKDIFQIKKQKNMDKVARIDTRIQQLSMKDKNNKTFIEKKVEYNKTHSHIMKEHQEHHMNSLKKGEENKKQDENGGKSMKMQEKKPLVESKGKQK